MRAFTPFQYIEAVNDRLAINDASVIFPPRPKVRTKTCPLCQSPVRQGHAKVKLIGFTHHFTCWNEMAETLTAWGIHLSADEYKLFLESRGATP